MLLTRKIAQRKLDLTKACTCYSALVTVYWLVRYADEKIKRENAFWCFASSDAGYAAIVFVATTKRENLRLYAIVFETHITKIFAL